MWASFLISAFAAVGATPKGYIGVDAFAAVEAALKLEKAINDSMHIREDEYRSLIDELKEQLEEKETDRKKALRKLRSTTHHLEELEQQRHLLGSPGGNSITEHDPNARSPHHHLSTLAHPRHHHTQSSSLLLSNMSVHITSWLTAVCIFTTYQVETCPSVHKKVLQLAMYMLILMYPVTIKKWVDWLDNPVVLGFNVFLCGYVAALTLT